MQERRKFNRADIQYRIRIICEGEVILGEPESYSFATYTENIGEAGIKVNLEKQIKIASLVNLELYISNKDILPMACKGSVIWSKKISPEGKKPEIFETGIQFIQLSDIDHQIICNIIRRHYKKVEK